MSAEIILSTIVVVSSLRTLEEGFVKPSNDWHRELVYQSSHSYSSCFFLRTFKALRMKEWRYSHAHFLKVITSKRTFAPPLRCGMSISTSLALISFWGLLKNLNPANDSEMKIYPLTISKVIPTERPLAHKPLIKPLSDSSLPHILLTTCFLNNLKYFHFNSSFEYFIIDTSDLYGVHPLPGRTNRWS